MKFVLYCESDLDNMIDIVKTVEKTGKLSVKNVYVSAEDVIDNKNEKQEQTVKNHNKQNHKTPYIARTPRDKGWEEYDKTTNMPTLS